MSNVTRILLPWVGMLALGSVNAALARAETLRVAILAPPGLEPAARRLSAEVEAHGFIVGLHGMDGPAAAPEAVLALACANRAAAVLVLMPAARGVEVWIVNRTGRAVLSREVVWRGSEPEAVLALRAVEVLRGRLLEVVRTIPAAPPAPVAPAHASAQSRPPPAVAAPER